MKGGIRQPPEFQDFFDGIRLALSRVLWDNSSRPPFPIVPEASAIMASVTRAPTQPEIVYPDSDGKPMSDHTLQYKWIVVIREGLASQFAEERDIFVGANLLWYPVEGKPTIRGAPDVMIAFGRPQGERGAYKQWVEGGIAPHVGFEGLSPGNRPAEVERKFGV